MSRKAKSQHERYHFEYMYTQDPITSHPRRTKKRHRDHIILKSRDQVTQAIEGTDIVS